MQDQQDQYAKRRWSWRVRVYVVSGALAALLAAFAGGLYAGRWAVKIQLRARIDEAIEHWRNPAAKPAAYVDGTLEWQPINTALVRIETARIHMPNTAETSWGGGIAPLDDDRIFFGTRTGEFGVIRADGIVKVSPFKLEMNLDALRRHPVHEVKGFSDDWVRVTDINLTRISEDNFELLVGHHYFQQDKTCMELRLSRAVVSVQGEELSLAEPFETLLTTNPCITFNPPELYEFPFTGHLSGGRIVRFGKDQVLFSTGDHGWVGLKGFPAVAQDDNSTLGKVLLVNLATKEVSIFAKGFRNPQGLAADSQNRVWLTEQGPQGGDELNLIVKGGNYGWPDNTYGVDYGPIPWPMNAVQGRHDTGIKPQFAWNPSIATSNLVEVTGDEFLLWKGDLLVSSLGGQAIHRLRLDGTRVVYDEPIKFDLYRLRDIVELPTGRIAVLTDRGIVLLLRNSDAHAKTPYLDATKQQPQTVDMSPQQRAYAVAGRYANPAKVSEVVAHQLSPAASRGELVFKQNCAACHSAETETTGVGPSLNGIVGRQVGTGSFAYSAALMGKHDSWTARRIVAFASNPNGMYPGSKMAPVPLTPDLQRDLESYLNASTSLSAKAH
jgi:cytochrome c2